jgi:hypothetical protein
MNPKFSLLCAAVALLSTSAVEASGHGACAPSCCPEACCVPKVRYKTCYQTVVECKDVCTYETVQRTIMKECRYTICKPVYEEQVRECRKIVCETVWEERQVEVCGGHWREEAVCIPGPCVTKKCRLPDTCCYDPCTCKAHRIKGQTVCYTEKLPDRTVCKKVWVPTKELKVIKVAKPVQREVIEKVPVKVCKYVHEEVVKQVPVTVCEKVPVVKKVQVCRKVKVCVPVCEMVCAKPSLFDRCKGLFGGHGCGNDCCDAGHGGYYAAPGAPAPKAELLPAPKGEAPKVAPPK